MAKTHRSKPHQLKLSESGKPHELNAEDWFELTNSGCARVESDTKQGRVAVLCSPFIGWVQDGQLWISRIGVSIKSTWLAFEREYLRRVKTSDLYVWQDGHLWLRSELGKNHPLMETGEVRKLRVARERDAEFDIEASVWRTTRGSHPGRNSIRCVSPEHLAEVLQAFRRSPSRIAGQQGRA